MLLPSRKWPLRGWVYGVGRSNFVIILFQHSYGSAQNSFEEIILASSEYSDMFGICLFK